MTMMVFDIETVPDVRAGRQLHDVPHLDEEATSDAMLTLRRQQTGHEFLQHYLHQVVAISVVVRHQDWIKVWSLGEVDDGEKALLQRFFQGIEKYTPTLISWNGSGFDLPVLHYRSMIHGVQAPQYWEVGERDQQFKWNNYINRYHYRHLDLMDVLAGYQARANAPLDDLAVLCGFPGKMGLKGNQVLEKFRQGHIEAIRDYCESDVLNTYLIYLRFQLIRGQLDEQTYHFECQLLEQSLANSDKQHLKEFLEKWKTAST